MLLAQDRLILASLNAHCGRDSAGLPYPISAAIESLDSDVVLIQENWRAAGHESVASRVARENDYPYCIELDVLEGTSLRHLGVVSGTAENENGTLGLALLSRWPASAQGTVLLGRAPGDMMERAAQVVEVTVGGDWVVAVVNAHLTHRLRHGPGQLRRLVRAVRRGARPVVIAGDMNMCRPAVYLAYPFRPAVRGRTWLARRPWAQLDHVLVSGGIRALGSCVGPAVGSDHLPIRATLGAEDRPAAICR